MRNREWELVMAIASEKSISRAAEKLYMSQPALSMFLNRLESQMGTKLFTRSVSGLVPTYAGDCYIRTAEKVLKLCNDFETELCDISQLHKGKVKVGATVHLGSYVFPIVLPLYKERYPNIQIEIKESDSAGLEKALTHSDIDIALMHMPFLSMEATYETIAVDHFVMVFSQDNPLSEYIYQKDGVSYIDPRCTEGEKFVLSYPTQRVRQISDKILERAGVVPDIAFMTSSVETALRVASVGIGVTFMPESYIKLFTCPVEPHYCRLEDEYNAYWTFVAAYPSLEELSKPAKEFVRILKENYR